MGPLLPFPNETRHQFVLPNFRRIGELGSIELPMIWGHVLPLYSLHIVVSHRLGAYIPMEDDYDIGSTGISPHRLELVGNGTNYLCFKNHA